MAGFLLIQKCFMKFTSLILLMAGAMASLARADDAKAAKLAEEVVAASGGANWPRVHEIHFTFNVAVGSEMKLSAKHDWNVQTGMDTVTWGGKTATANVYDPNQTGDKKEACARWVNDSYWLLMPLKLKDKGVNIKDEGVKKLNGKPYEVVQLSFGKVGMTSGDRYNLYLNPETHLVDAFDYMPNFIIKVNATWTGYKKVGGLTLSTEHMMAGRRIWISDLKVQ